jgi:gentisate 1,2-dioxygenase
VHFVEHFKESRYPAVDVDTQNSPVVFPWSRMQAQLDAAKGNWVSKPYLTTKGTEVSKIIGGSAERLDAGTASPNIRETASSVYHVVEGKGYSEIDGKKYSWKRGDTFCVPAWNRYQHFATEEKTVYLYRFDDKPMLKALGFYRLDGMDVESLVSE